MSCFYKRAKKGIVFLLFITGLQAAAGEYLVSSSKIGSMGSLATKIVLAYAGIPFDGVPVYGVDAYKIVYNTTDAHGFPTIASGALYVPSTGTCTYLPLLSWQHTTEFDKNEVASNNKGNWLAGQMLSAFGYLVTMPDYLGMGENPGIHPFHHGPSEATAAIDLMRAAREFLQAEGTVTDNNQLFITGYSQGGHATMALHNYIQEHNLYNEFNVVASAPMSGAYDLAGAQFDLIFDGDSIFPVNAFFPYMLASFQHVYGNIYSSYQAIYDAPYDATAERLLAGNYTWGEWSSALPANFYHFMQDSVIENMLADETRRSHPVLKAMYENSYINWVPERPVKMLYAGNDNIVSPLNALNTQDRMISLGAMHVEAVNADPAGDHEGGFIPLLVYTLNWFQSLKKPCERITLSDYDRSDTKLQFYPNPATDAIHVNGNEVIRIEIYDLTGQQVMSRTNTTGVVFIGELKPGLYLVAGYDITNKRLKTSHLIVQ